MYQTVLMLFAPQGAAPQQQPEAVASSQCLANGMATRLQPEALKSSKNNASACLAVVGNALGFLVIMSGAGLLLSLAETLIN